MSFGEILTQLRKERGFKNRKSFADYIGIPSTTLRNYETNVREPGHIFLTQMANIFNVSTDYLLGLTPERTPHISKNDENIKKYRLLNTDGKEKVGEYIDDLLANPKYRAENEQDPQEETVKIFRAAMSTDHHEAEIREVPKKDIERLASLPHVTSEDDL